MRYRVRFEDISLFHASFISFSRKINCRFNGIIGIIVFTDFYLILSLRVWDG